MKKNPKRIKVFIVLTAVALIGASCFMLRFFDRVNAAAENASSGTSSAVATCSPETLRYLVTSREFRRSDTIIPSTGGNIINESDAWVKIAPENSEALKAAAFAKSAEYAKAFFGITLHGDFTFTYYSDSEKHREDFVQIALSDSEILCTLTADTLDLINIDYAIPAEALPGLESPMPRDGEPSADILRIANEVAGVFGTEAAAVRRAGSTSNTEHEFEDTAYNIKAANGVFLKFSVLNGKLYAVGAYPTEGCMIEGVYFKADVQRDDTIVRLASPRNFSEGRPGADDMTMDEAKQIYLDFLKLAGGAASYSNPTEMTFYIDHSGARENYWHVKGEKLEMEIASKSKWLVSVVCGDLVNPENDLSTIDFDNMGGLEYKIYVRDIMSGLYGDDLVKVGPNARGDGHYCTYDAWMKDGTRYEFYFTDGRLTEVKYFFNDECISYFGGWKADFTYVNTTTGETFFFG